jgi:hypothetical protein
MFLPVFVHPGKRGPSPVKKKKKSPEKSTAKGGPPSATSSAPGPPPRRRHRRRHRRRRRLCHPVPGPLTPVTPAASPRTTALAARTPRAAPCSHPAVAPAALRAPPHPPPPAASRMHVSPCTLSLRVKKYLRPPAPPARPPARPSVRPPGRFFPHTCVKASRPHTRTHDRERARVTLPPPPAPTHPVCAARARGGDVTARGMRRAEDGRRCFRRM